jgi:hypothetical protein
MGPGAASSRGAAAGFEATGLVEPKPVKSVGSATVNGLLWRGAGAAGVRPLLVMVHGGPTGQSLADWTPQVQAFVNGWSVLRPTTGSRGGRVHAGAGRPVGRPRRRRRGGGDPPCREEVGPAARRILGGSAGDDRAPSPRQYPDLVQAVVAQYPVCDLVDLALTTHR